MEIYRISCYKKSSFLGWSPAVTQVVQETGDFGHFSKEDSIKECLQKFGQEGCDGNQDNAINSEDIQTSVVANGREVYQQGEVYIDTKRRSGTVIEKGKKYQLKTLFEKRKKLRARMTRKCKLIDDLIYSSSNQGLAIDVCCLRTYVYFY